MMILLCALSSKLSGQIGKIPQTRETRYRHINLVFEYMRNIVVCILVKVYNSILWIIIISTYVFKHGCTCQQIDKFTEKIDKYRNK